MVRLIAGLLPILRTASGRLVSAMLCGIAGTAMMAAAPYLAGKTLDLGILSGNTRAFLYGSLLAALAVAGAEACSALGDYLQSSARCRVNFELARRLFRARVRKPYESSLGDPDGEYSVLMHSERTASFLATTLPYSLLSLVRGVLALGMAFYIDWRPAVMAIAAGGAVCTIAWPFARRSGQRSEAVNSAAQGMFARCGNLLSGLYVIKALGMEKAVTRVFTRSAALYAREQARFHAEERAAALVPQWLGRGATGLIAVYCGWLAVKGIITPGQSAAAVFYITQAASLPQALSDIIQQTAEDGPSLKAAAEAVSVQETARPESRPETPVCLQAKTLSFSYGDKAVFSGLSFSTKPAMRIRISGPSGCGKTTLINLIAGVTRPAGGTLTINGKAAGSLSGLALCPQNPILFSLPVRQNIGMAAPDWKEESFRKGAETAGLNGGLLERENADDLSQGQKQRVSLARALVSEPALLLLDESFSGLEPSAEEEIFRRLGGNYPHMAVIFVSHRPCAATAEEAEVSLS